MTRSSSGSGRDQRIPAATPWLYGPTTFLWLFPAVVPFALALSLTAGTAPAQNMESAAGEAAACVAWTPAAALGLVTDTAIGIQLVTRDERASRTWSVLGTVTWSIATACWAPVVSIALDSGNYPNAPSSQWANIGVASAGAAVTLGSLALSIYGLTRPPLPPGPMHPATARGLAFAPPLLAPTVGGARIILGAAF